MSEKSRKTDREGPRENCHWLSLFVSGRANDLSPSWVRLSHHVAGPQGHMHTHSKKKYTSEQNWDRASPQSHYISLTTPYVPEVQEADGVWRAHEFSLQDGDIWKWQISCPPPPFYLFPLAQSVLCHPHLTTEDNSGILTVVTEGTLVKSTLWNSFPLDQHIVAYASLLWHTTLCACRKSVQANAHMQYICRRPMFIINYKWLPSATQGDLSSG